MPLRRSGRPTASRSGLNPTANWKRFLFQTERHRLFATRACSKVQLGTAMASFCFRTTAAFTVCPTQAVRQRSCSPQNLPTTIGSRSFSPTEGTSSSTSLERCSEGASSRPARWTQHRWSSSRRRIPRLPSLRPASYFMSNEARSWRDPLMPARCVLMAPLFQWYKTLEIACTRFMPTSPSPRQAFWHTSQQRP